MTNGRIILQRTDGFAYLTLDRPRARNRLSPAMAASLQEACQELGQDPGVRVVIITGQGDTFSCGWERPRRGASLAQAASALAALEKPVIAVLPGDATDQGLELALAADIRVAAEEARLGFTMVRDGFLPWGGGTQRLPRLVGRAKALEMLLLGTLVSAGDALALGLVNRVAPRKDVMGAAHELAARIRDAAPIASGYAKEAVLRGLDLSLEYGLRLEADLNFLLHTTHDRAEGLKSFLERRRPQFRGE